jgi:hypothetical protein
MRFLVTILLGCVVAPSAAQDTLGALPISIIEPETHVLTLMSANSSRLRDGRVQAAWRFSHRAGTIQVEVFPDVPVEVRGYRFPCCRDRLVGAPLFTMNVPAGETRRSEMSLPHYGQYVVLVRGAQGGLYHLGVGVPAVQAKPVIPLPPLRPLVPTGAFFTSLTLTPNHGRVGYHIGLAPQLSAIPQGCEWHPRAVRLGGDVPTGFHVVEGSTAVVGTPRELGTWVFSYTLIGLHCTGSPIDYGDRTASVTFTVEQ